MYKGLLCTIVLSSIALFCQTATTTSSGPTGDKPRVFITDSQSWEMEGAAGGTGGTFGAHTHGGARPQTAEIIKTFSEKCPNVVVNNMREKAAFIVVLDHEGGKGALRHKNKVAVFDAQTGDSIVSKSTLSLGGSVEEACRAITKAWANHKPETASTGDPAPNSDPSPKQQPAPAIIPAAASVPAPPAGARLSITSVPDGADIEIDSAFVGSTPSSIQLPPGDHNVIVKKNGYKPWIRTLRVSGGDIGIKAELEKN